MKNMYKILSCCLILSSGIYGQAVVSLEPSSLPRSGSGDSQLTMTLNSAQQILGVQFDISYNPVELQFESAQSLLPAFMFDYRLISDGLVRGLLFSMSRDVINPHNIVDLITFDFSPVKGYAGDSQIEFTDLRIVNDRGVKIPVTSSPRIETIGVLPGETKLNACYPNPFNPTTSVSYILSSEAQVQIAVFDIQGRRVAKLVDLNQDAGSYNTQWDAGQYPSGLYFLKMVAGDYQVTQKLLLVK